MNPSSCFCPKALAIRPPPCTEQHRAAAYAHQDKEDDALVGIKSTARLFGDRSRPWIGGFYAVCVVLLALAGWLAGLTWPFFGGLALAAAHLVWQTASADFDDPKNCLTRFKSNRDFGLIVLAAIVAGQVI